MARFAAIVRVFVKTRVASPSGHDAPARTASHRAPVAVLLGILTWMAVLASAKVACADEVQTPQPVLASIRLRHPTASQQMVVEVPVGQLAAPGRIDWTRVQLLREDGGEVPFSIREGRVHWQARLIAPITSPRAEDLLVFSAVPPRNAWSRLRLVAGPRHDRPALIEMADRLVVTYPGLEAAVSVSTGMLTRLVAQGEPLLAGPLDVVFWKIAGPAGDRQSLRQPRRGWWRNLRQRP